MRLPPVLTAEDLPLAELQAVRLDGEVFALDAAFTPIDEVESPRHRARAAHAGLPQRLIAEQHTAAWIWGAAPPPQRHEFCVAIAARARVAGDRGHAVREVVIGAAEVAIIDGLSVTTPMRTVCDLARFSAAFGRIEEDASRHLMLHHGFTIDDGIDEIERRRNLPRKHRAIGRLMALRAL
jgi:hypothetical protein